MLFEIPRKICSGLAQCMKRSAISMCQCCARDQAICVTMKGDRDLADDQTMNFCVFRRGRPNFSCGPPAKARASHAGDFAGH